MIRHVGKWLFPNDKHSARRRKMRILYCTILGGILASALIALTYIWMYQSRRFE
jgi:hypothetical protein